MPDFHTWFVSINNTTFTEIILPVDADEVILICPDDHWLICDVADPADPRSAFPVHPGQHWSLVFTFRRTKTGVVIGYAKSTSQSSATLHCYTSLPVPFTGVRP
jgi:hypothetical protein